MAEPDTFPAQNARIAVDGPAGVLEAAVGVPDAGAARPAVAVISHPHPPDGGTMDNKVVTTLERALRELGLPTVRFNFRGVGASAGSYDRGEGETEDLLAVARWAQRTRPGHALWLAGFSFGAFIAARAEQRIAATQLISIAPPVNRFALAHVPPPRCPWLVVQGEADEIVDPDAVFAWLTTVPQAPTLIRMPGVGHFFHGKLLDLRAALQDALRPVVPAA